MHDRVGLMNAEDLRKAFLVAVVGLLERVALGFSSSR
jgi:hypothetical protein